MLDFCFRMCLDLADDNQLIFTRSVDANFINLRHSLLFIRDYVKEASSMNKDGSILSKSHFGCYFRCSFVNFKNLIVF